jgi:NADH-quinone oxidoreductase subunit N
MNYGQFLNMVPEFYLVCILLVVFFMDFFFARRSDKNHEVFGGVTIGLMLVLPVRIALLSEPTEAGPMRRTPGCSILP